MIDLKREIQNIRGELTDVRRQLINNSTPLHYTNALAVIIMRLADLERGIEEAP